MAILSLSIYGSRSRGDYSESSDIDLFAITDNDHYKMVVNGITNMACYPTSLALQRASEGDLFILHLCKEAKEIYHSEFSLNQLKDAFKYKDSYSHEIMCASDLAWYLIDFNNEVRNPLLINKRIAWCVRTIIIAKSAESRQPVFSTKGLIKFSRMPDVYKLISLKDSVNFNKNCVSLLEIFLKSMGLNRPSTIIDNTQSYYDLFNMTNNTMGIKTFERLESESLFTGYI
ncbi:nucleotidyltransferase domain-containing protein [Aeromonas caviae]|uniref:anti-phage Hailong system nucleotidyltransferase HalB n=1 Tax=Aeromonas caviae TaxID=648 RepID=UPI0038D10D62